MNSLLWKLLNFPFLPLSGVNIWKVLNYVIFDVVSDAVVETWSTVLFTYPKLFHQQIFSLYGYPQIHCPRSFHDFVPPSMVQLQLDNNVFSCTSCSLSPARSPFTYPSSFNKTCHTPNAFPQKRLLFKLLREGKYKNGNFIISLISNPEYVYLLYISFWHLGPLSGQEKAPENTKNMTPK